MVRGRFDPRQMSFDSLLLGGGNGSAGSVDTDWHSAKLLRSGLQEGAGIAADIEHSLSAERRNIASSGQLGENISTSPQDRRAQLPAQFEIGVIEVVFGIVNCGLLRGVQPRKVGPAPARIAGEEGRRS